MSYVISGTLTKMHLNSYELYFTTEYEKQRKSALLNKWNFKTIDFARVCIWLACMKMYYVGTSVWDLSELFMMSCI